MAQKVDLLINRNSRTAQQVAREVERELTNGGFELHNIHEITRKNTLSDAIKSIARSNPKVLIVAGGDGTVSSALDKLSGMKIEIGIIPLGTTNNFARSLDLPLGTIAEAVTIIREKSAKHVDLGRVNNEYFTNVAGVGLSARIAENVTDKEKRRYGRFAYAITSVRQIFKQKPFMVTLQDPDHELSFTMETRQLIIANGRYHAGKEIATDAKVDNGQLLIFALGGRSLGSLFKHIIDFYVGKRRRVAHSSYFVGRNVQIQTSSPQPLELDGEVGLMTPVVVEVKHAAIKVRY